MPSLEKEKRLLQICVVAACVVPLAAGAYGAARGVAWLDGGGAALDNHFRYLSGLLLGIGIGFLTAVPHIERYRERFRLLTCIVLAGGMCRLLGLFLAPVPDFPMTAALGMELVITPLLCFWQNRLAAKFGG